MKVFPKLVSHGVAGFVLLFPLVFGLSAAGQEISGTRVVTVKTTSLAGGAMFERPAGVGAGSRAEVRRAVPGARTTEIGVRRRNLAGILGKAPVSAVVARPEGSGPPAALNTTVNSVSFGSSTVGGTATAMTLTYPMAAVSAGGASTVGGGGVAPGSASDYIFFGNSSVEFGGTGGGQPSHLTNFSVSTLANVEYPGNSNYTTVMAPGGTTAFRTGSLTENPSNYPNTTPHTDLLATFSPLAAGSFTVYLLDGNTDGVYVGNSSVGLGVNGSAEISTPSPYLSGHNQFTAYTVTNAATTDVFQVYATTSSNSYPTIGGLTFTPGATMAPIGSLTATATANLDFTITSSTCTASACTVGVKFAALHPGLLSDAISLADSNGHVVYKTFVYGVGRAPQFAYDLGNESIYYGFTPHPQNVAIGPDETLYYTSTNSPMIYKATHNFSSASSITLNGLAGPSGMVVDGSNTLYVADQTNNDVLFYTAAGVQGTLTTTALSGPTGLAVDGTGALYVADTGHGRVIKIDNQGTETTIASGLSAPKGVAVDSAGNVFYSDDANAGELFRLSAGSSSATTVQTNFNQTVQNIAVDASGAIYFTGSNGLNVLTPGGQQEYTATGNDVSYGLAIDRNGGVYLTQPLGGTFTVNDRSASNFILNTAPRTPTSGTLPISNTGNMPLTFSGFSITGPQFSIDATNPCMTAGTINPGASCNVTIDFTPPAAKYYTDALVVTSNSLNAGGTTDPFYLAGNGEGASSTTTLTDAASGVQVNTPEQFLVTVADAGGFTPNGSVTFLDGTTAIGAGTLAAGTNAGTATTQFSTSSLAVGSHSITAVFPGDLNVSPSTSNAVTVTVTTGAPVANGNVRVDSKNFGSSPLGTPVAMTVTYAVGGGGITIATNPYEDFVVSGVGCDDSCTATVTFTPQFPGLRTSAVMVRDHNGVLLAKTYVYGVGTAPQFGFDPGSDVITQVSQNYASVAIGPDNKQFYADSSTDQVIINTNGAGGSIGVANLGTPAGIAVDGGETVYIADQTHNLIVTYGYPSGGQGTVATTPLSSPTGVAVDGAGSVYITDTGHNRIIKVDNQGVETVLVSAAHAPTGIAVDAAGDVFYADGGNGGEIVELPVGGGSPVTVETSLGTVNYLAVDAGGRIYYTGYNGLTIIGLNKATGGYPLSGQPGPGVGLALDESGNIIVTQPTTQQYVISVRNTSTYSMVANVGAMSQETFYVANTGTSPLTLSGLVLTGSVFTIDATSQCTATTVLTAGQTCRMTIDFRPTAAVPYNETITFTSNNLNVAGSTNTYTLQGTGQGTEAVFSATTLSFSPATPTVGQAVTFLASVADTSGVTPAGTVNFFDGTTMIGTAMLGLSNAPGTAPATFVTSALAAGSHSITATYVGSANVMTSTSSPQTVVVQASAPPTATTTTLTVSPGTVAYKTPVTLMAAVARSGGGAVTVGQVIFCDATAAYCNPVLSLATAQLNASGTATVKLAPGMVGGHSYTALFLGTTALLKSASTAQTVTVTGGGTYASTTAITSAGSMGNYSLTGVVTGLGTRVLQPSGTVTFNDTSNPSGPVLGTAALGASIAGFTAVQAAGSPNAVGSEPYGVATGDFNGDGFVDVVVENYSGNSVSVLLGKGDGTFQPQVSYAVGSLPERVLVADFNGDGKLDLVVANTGSGTVSILLGNGDGTFQAQATYGAGSPVGLGVLDLNHDGIADIVAGDYYSNTVSVLLGNGDGTFRAAVTYATGGTPQTLAEGDFNGDGNVDLAVGNYNDGTVGIFLGNGDGTFQTQVTYAVGAQPQGVQVGDFNGDGKEDLAVSNSHDGTISILLGKGDGTFGGQVTYSVGANPVGLVIADFNGDGKQDLSVSNTARTALTQSILLGNGDGTFQPQMVYPTGNFPYGQAVGDFNGDGYPDLAISNFVDGTATILLSEATETASATIQGVSLGGAAGTHNVDASYPGDGNFGASTSTTIPLTSVGIAAPAASGTRLTIAPAAPTRGQSVLFSVVVAGSTQTTPPPTGTVTLLSVSGTAQTTLGTIMLDGTGSGMFSTSSLAVGSYTIRAMYGGDGKYAASSSGAQMLTVSATATTTTLGISAATLSAGQPETLTAVITGGSSPALSGTVTFADQNGTLGTGGVVASSTGGTATLTVPALSVATHRITASYGGDTNYGGSVSAPQSVVVSLAAQTITFGPIANHTVGDSPFALGATASSGLTVTYTVFSGPATVAGSTVTLTGAGMVVIQAAQAGNATYAAAPNVTQTFTVSPALPVLASISPSVVPLGSGATVVTLSGSGFTANSVVQVNGAAVATTYVSNTALTALIPAASFTKAGALSITVANPTISAVSGVVTLTVVPANPAITLTGPSVTAPGSQPVVSLTITNRYPLDLTAVFSLGFASAATPKVDDPAIQFAAGGRTLTIVVPANSTVVPPIQLQAGTDAGTITIPLVLTAGGVNVTPPGLAPVVIVVPATVPTISTTTVTRAAGTLSVAIHGFSNTREVTTATFHFVAAPGATITTPDLTAPVGTVFATWFGSTASPAFGSTFTYTQMFNISDDAKNIGSVQVTLTNTVGASALGDGQ